MGLFDKVLGAGTTTFDARDGFAGVCFTAIAADGVLTEEEQVGLVTTLARMRLFEGVSNRELSKTFEKIVKVARDEGVDAVMKRSAEAVKPELRATAFAVAADLALADGHVAMQEKAVLEKLQQALGLDDATALKIVEVLQIKNQG